MEVGAVPEVLKNMLGFDKGLLTNPGHSFTTHLAEGIGLAVHPGDHIVAARHPVRDCRRGSWWTYCAGILSKNRGCVAWSVDPARRCIPPPP